MYIDEEKEEIRTHQCIIQTASASGAESGARMASALVVIKLTSESGRTKYSDDWNEPPLSGLIHPLTTSANTGGLRYPS